MKIKLIFFISLLINILFINYSKATVISAIASGYWHDQSTWENNIIPGPTDTVLIDGFDVRLDKKTGHVTIKHLIINDLSNTAPSNLILESNQYTTSLTITDDIEASNSNQNVSIIVDRKSSLYVGNDVIFYKNNINPLSNDLSLILFLDSKMEIGRHLIYHYVKSDVHELNNEIYLDLRSDLLVKGNAEFYLEGDGTFNFHMEGNALTKIENNLIAEISGGNDLNIYSESTEDLTVIGKVDLINNGGEATKPMLETNDGSFVINGNLNLTSNVSTKKAFIQSTNSPNAFDIAGNINMIAQSDGDVSINLNTSSGLSIAGNVNRVFGSLIMDNTSTFTYDGITTQIISPEKVAGGGNDSFNYGILALNNPGGFTLLDTLKLANNLALSSGKIATDSSKILVMGDNAMITGGNRTAFIEGPILKTGRSNGTDFEFPIGKGNVYAPLQVSEITNIASEMKAEYFSDPPPFELPNTYEADLLNISETQYWNFTKKAGSDNVDITLGWDDALLNRVTNLDSVVVTGLDGTVWRNYGNGQTAGGIGSGVAGSVTSLLSDPPPFEIETFTFGFMAPDGVLPVDLTKFQAIQQDEHVYMKWETASEINTSHFEIEHSEDGFNFEKINSTFSKGEGESLQQYSYKDLKPNSGMNYYRLKIVDRDEKYEYSHIEVVIFESSPELQIYPNPVKKMIQIKGKDLGKNTIEVFDRNGKRIYLGNMVFENEFFSIPTETANIKNPGTYFLRITNKSGSTVLKFIKY